MSIKDWIKKILDNEMLKKKIIEIYKNLKLRDEQVIYFAANMLAQRDDSASDDERFHREFNNLISIKNNQREKILLFHLIIEHFMDKYLNIIITPEIKKDIKLDFVHKLLLISNNYGPTFIFHEGILEINKLRNRFAHKLNYVIVSTDIHNIKTNNFLSFFDENNQIKPPLKLIEKFTEAVCIMIETEINNNRRVGTRKIIPSYKDYV